MFDMAVVDSVVCSVNTCTHFLLNNNTIHYQQYNYCQRRMSQLLVVVTVATETGDSYGLIVDAQVVSCLARQLGGWLLLCGQQVMHRAPRAHRGQGLLVVNIDW